MGWKFESFLRGITYDHSLHGIQLQEELESGTSCKAMSQDENTNGVNGDEVQALKLPMLRNLWAEEQPAADIED